MIHPTNADLLKGVEAALRETVLPELARGTAARKQMQAALEILRRIAFALPKESLELSAEYIEMDAVLRYAAKILDEPRAPYADGDLQQQNLTLQQQILDLQERLPGLPETQRAEITKLLIGLHKRATERLLALLPPPALRPAKKP